MCDQDHLHAMPRMNRRSFGALAGMGALAACTSMEGSGSAGGLTQSSVSFAADGGTMDGVFIHPAEGRHPGVILWPDIAGLRPAKIEMGRRLAAEGYAVLVANPYYRSVAGQQFADFDAWRDGGMQVTQPWRARNTPEAVTAAARRVVGWLDAQAAVDTARGIGNQGYCMTGSWTILTAAAVPSRVKAAASFHGGGLVGDGPMAPVNLLSRLAPDAQALIAIARDDDAQAPNDKVALRAAAEAAAADIAVEVYAGDHGWTVLDSPVYNAAEANRAWTALLALYAQL
ncbi:dienelactone hydrolase family protein [Erythrobacter arachoides]|uniref:Dienelactone hydrolase family protein n=1 Tax=Aurantiacibacter arachoides TaxID=1850444 RepID=A0A844ZWL2_9SPHN|nr:dienelactone hydrolase family protein [Aurantiacibacter arachoides]MXO92128.1 dienelactone hydrolase family protein [Aurantiacibacter arachoides]GGD59482.1 hydrolase [Aurantiacibacter arachoides]